MVAGFLDNESIFASTTTLMVKQTLEEVRVSQYQLEQCRSKCESVLSNPHLIADVLMKIEQDSLPVADSDLLGLSLLTEKERMAGRWCLSQLLPRLISVPSVLLKMQITCRERALAVDLRVLEKLLETIEDELEAIEDFENKREEYAESTRLLRAELLKLRRQRATQRELDERNGRLKELRDKRQREKLELLLRLAEEERLRKLEAEKHPPRPKPNYVNKVGPYRDQRSSLVVKLTATDTTKTTALCCLPHNRLDQSYARTFVLPRT